METATVAVFLDIGGYVVGGVVVGQVVEQAYERTVLVYACMYNISIYYVLKGDCHRSWILPKIYRIFC
jgi:hypothetical protein